MVITPFLPSASINVFLTSEEGSPSIPSCGMLAALAAAASSGDRTTLPAVSVKGVGVKLFNAEGLIKRL